MKGLNFRKSIQLLPGLKINLSKTGASVTVGPRGAHLTVGRGRPKISLDLPGSGIYYRRTLGDSRSQHDKKTEPEARAAEGDQPDHNGAKKDDQEQERKEDQHDTLNLGLLNRLSTPPDEQELVDGLQELSRGNDDKAFDHLRRATSLPDGAFLAGMQALRRGEFGAAVGDLSIASAEVDRLGQYFAKYNIDPTVDLPVTEDVVAEIRPNKRGVLFALSEAYQHAGMPKEAIECLRQVQDADSEDLVVRAALAELYEEVYPDDPQMQQHIVELAEGVHNESPVHASLMYYRARALRKLKLFDAAQDTVTQALRRKKEYPSDLLIALRYERALLFEATGKTKRAQTEFQKIYTEAPDFEDVAAKVGLTS